MAHYSIGGDATSEVVYRKHWEKYLDNFELLMYDVGKENCLPGHDWGPDKRGCHVIHKVISGKGIFFINGKEFEVSAGQIFYFSPTDLVYYKADEQDPMSYIWVSFDGTKSGIIMRSTVLPKLNVLPDSEDSLVERGILDIFNAAAKEHNIYIVLGHLYLFFGELVEHYKLSEDNSDASIKNAYVNSAIAYIEENYAGKCATSDIAQHLGIARSYLYKIFKQYVGVSPTEYIENFRIQQACGLLITGSYSITEAAFAVGYQDGAYFSKVFKRVNEMSPKDFILERSKKI